MPRRAVLSFLPRSVHYPHSYEREKGKVGFTVSENNWTFADLWVNLFVKLLTEFLALSLTQNAISSSIFEGRREEREKGRCANPVSPSSFTLSHTVNATSQFISVCFSSVALAEHTHTRKLWFSEEKVGAMRKGRGERERNIPIISSYGFEGLPNIVWVY